MTSPAPTKYVSMAELLQDKARLDALERVSCLTVLTRKLNSTWHIDDPELDDTDSAPTIREVADRLLTAPPAK